jgi:hypothetical protein
MRIAEIGQVPSGCHVLSSRPSHHSFLPEPMEPSALSKQIERILRSQTFASKRQLRKLLEVLFKNLNSQAILTPDLVIRELWPEETRTKRSADVATEMNRLRHALESYYNGEGKADPITIILPNRSTSAVDGTQEKCWIAAKPRGGECCVQEGLKPGFISNDLRGAPPHPAKQRAEWGPRESAALPWQSESRRVFQQPLRAVKIMGALTALCAGLGILVYVSILVLTVHDQPQFGRLDGTVLRIMDGQGKELWTKSFPDGFSTDWYYDKAADTRIWFGDLEAKGHTSVLFSYLSAADRQPHSSTLICYSDRGKEKWRWTPGRELPELNGSSPTFRTMAVGVLKATDKRPPRIVVSSQHAPWWPNQIAILDSNGKTTSEYWHSGGLSYIVLADLDGDGREEIVATGVANGYDHQATLVVLDRDRVFGASTEVRPEFQIHGMGVAQERLRLLFPRSDLNRALFQFNLATDPTVEHGSIRLTVLECMAPTYGCPIWYEFDKNFHLISAYAGGDEFRSVHERFYQTGKDAHTLSAEEQAAFQKVRCLVGCKSEFVPVGKLVP